MHFWLELLFGDESSPEKFNFGTFSNFELTSAQETLVTKMKRKFTFLPF